MILAFIPLGLDHAEAWLNRTHDSVLLLVILQDSTDAKVAVFVVPAV